MAKKKSENDTNKTVTIRQVMSGAGRKSDQVATLAGLGLGKPNSRSTLIDTPSVRGMINKVKHLIAIESSI